MKEHYAKLKKLDTKEYTICFHLSKILEQAKLVYSVRKEKNGFLEPGPGKSSKANFLGVIEMVHYLIVMMVTRVNLFAKMH
jgi:hypothetical protein